MLEDSLTSRLLADATVSSLVGTNIYPVVLPETMPDSPLITYRKISDVTGYTLSGQAIIYKARIEYNAWSSTYSDAKAVAAAIQASLEGFAGTLGDVFICFIACAGVNTDGLDEDSRLYRVQQDFLISHA